MQPTDPYVPESLNLPLNLRALLENLSDRLRSQLSDNGLGPIEQLVGEAPEPYQATIFEELVIEEIQLRKMRGAQPTLEEYLLRFPDRAELVERAWQRAQPPRLGSTVDHRADDSDAQDMELGTGRADDPDPTHFGDYKVLRALGSGTFGSVYQAQHESTGAIVAIKVLKARWARDPDCGQAMRRQFAEEAKRMLQFDHPHVVKVIALDERTDPPYFVQQYIDGLTLENRLQAGRLTLEQILQFAIQIADGLAHIHSHECWHRDLKPANILLDRNQQIYLADFGLALDEAQRWSTRRGAAGTYPYMAPEQINGATHRLNARCDIWALGVILYEMLTGRRPFRSQTLQQLREDVTQRTPPTPRELNQAIPRELNRLCMQCLSKRDSDRPHAAADVRDDLANILQSLSQSGSPIRLAVAPPVNAEKSPAPDDRASSDSPIEYPVPTLKRFTAEQTELYLRLMPRGYATEEELPELITFWKTRILQRDPDQTFAVGIMVGVSGCGKSSMLEAGLVPALPESIIPILIEASETDTEVRILNKLRRALPDADPDQKWSLVDWTFRIRSGKVLPPGKKVVLILDQFEQWLNAHGGESTNQLLDALHQCDGEHLQAIVCVREGFHATLMRFVEALHFKLDEERNYATAHRFTPDHARFILTQFGRGLKRVDDPPTGQQQAFIDATVDALAESDRGVVCVRLVVLALVMQDRPWSVEELSKLGGLDGIGSQFLVDCFEGRTASEQYRRYLPAAMRVLAELLPAQGLEIKDVRSYEQLLAASELDKRQFDDLLNILVRKLFLLTPVEQVAVVPPSSSVSSSLTPHASSLYYQLTHDFLVPSIRDWLSRKLRETKAGRAQLRLQEATAAWTSKPENRNLPSMWEWFQIRRLTEPAKWKAGEKVLMQRATRYHTTRALLATTFAFALVLSALGIKRWNDQRLMDRDAASLVSKIETADFGKLADEFKKLPAMRAVVDPKLKAALEQTKPDSDERLKLSLALLPSDPTQLDSLVERLQSAQASQVQLLVDQLRPHKDKILESLWSAIEGENKAAWLPVASALADYDPSNERWRGVAAKVSDNLVRDPLRLSTWIELLRPAALQLNPELKRIFAATPDATRSQAQIDLATDILETYAAADFPVLHELILSGRPEQFARMFNEYEVFRKQAIEQLRSDVARTFVPDSNASADEVEQSRLRWIARQANAAVALMRLEDPQPVYQFLTVDRDPEALSQFIYRIRGREVSPSLLVKSFQELVKLPTPLDANERRQHTLRLYGMILGLGEFTVDQLPATDRDDLIAQLSGMYGDHPSRAVHSALGWLLRRWGQEERVRPIDETPLDYDASGMREWYVMEVKPPIVENAKDESTEADSAETPLIDLSAPIYFTMLVFPGDKFEMGEVGETETVEISGPIAVSDREVTWRQFSPIDGDDHRQRWEKQFKKELGGRRLLPEEPVFGVSWFDAVNYCRWLTAARMPGEKNQSYAKKELTAEQASKPGWLGLPDSKDWDWPMDPKKPGFRLLTEREWEYVARGGMETTYSFGTSEALLDEYGWYEKNSGGWSHPTAMLRPSVAGLFDIHGNLWEWTDDWYTKGSYRVVRGGSWGSDAALCRTANRSGDTPAFRSASYGFRLALVPSGSAGLGPAEPGAGGQE